MIFPGNYPPIWEKIVLVFKKGRSNVPVAAQPVHLGRHIPVYDITFLVLETPGSHDQGIPFTDPYSFLDFSLDPTHAGDPVITTDPDMVRSHHQFGLRELFFCPFFR